MYSQIASILFMTVAGTVQGIALEYMLETNDKRTNKLFRVIYWTILAFIPSAINVLGENIVNSIGLRQMVHWGMAIIAMFWFYKDPIWRRIVAVFLVYLGMCCADLMFPLTSTITGLEISYFLDRSNPVVMFFVGIGMSISVICIFMIAFVWRKFIHKSQEISYVYFFIIYMLNHFVTFMIMETQLWQFDLQQHELNPAITGFICEAAMLVIVFSQSEKESLTKELGIEKRKTELERIHFAEVTKRRKELLDMSENSHLEIEMIRKVLLNNNIQQAEEQLLELLRKVESTKEYPYCEIPIINAVLSEKNKICDEQNIILNIDIHLTDELEIQQIDLCSVFGNLLDNAIRECKKITARNEMAKIDLVSDIKGNYLIVKCFNSLDGEISKNPEGTGLGFEILRDIARRYDGDFKIESAETVFKASMILKV